MDINTLVNELGKYVFNRAKRFACNGDPNYEYGWFALEIGDIMSNMNLSEEQIRVLTKRIKQLRKAERRANQLSDI
jgi:ribosomal protein S15P/S13E